MNEPHPARVTPSWHGDSVGHYEGDTLVIDTVGQRTDRPFAMVDLYGTPYSEKLHVVERYRLHRLRSRQGRPERDRTENFLVLEGRDPNYRGKHLQVHFTVEDDDVFTTPWTATITYRRSRATANGWRSCAPTTGMSITTTRSRRCHRRTSRIFEYISRGQVSEMQNDSGGNSSLGWRAQPHCLQCHLRQPLSRTPSASIGVERILSKIRLVRGRHGGPLLAGEMSAILAHAISGQSPSGRR